MTATEIGNRAVALRMQILKRASCKPGCAKWFYKMLGCDQMLQELEEICQVCATHHYDMALHIFQIWFPDK